jgi:hypothetical protein
MKACGCYTWKSMNINLSQVTHLGTQLPVVLANVCFRIMLCLAEVQGTNRVDCVKNLVDKGRNDLRDRDSAGVYML